MGCDSYSMHTHGTNGPKTSREREVVEKRQEVALLRSSGVPVSDADTESAWGGDRQHPPNLNYVLREGGPLSLMRETQWLITASY